MRAVLGLVARRQAGLWKDWRPWLALVVMALPAGMLLSQSAKRMADGSAVTIWMYANNWVWAQLGPGFRGDLARYMAVILVEYLTLSCWSWASGLALGFLSRRTLWINGSSFGLVLVFEALQVTRRQPSNSPVSSMTFYNSVFPLIVMAGLVLLPSLWGMKQGLRLATGRSNI